MPWCTAGPGRSSGELSTLGKRESSIIEAKVTSLSTIPTCLLVVLTLTLHQTRKFTYDLVTKTVIPNSY